LEFARKPVGSGPFMFSNREGRYVVFRANPHYGDREGRDGLPRIREIRFFKSQQPAVDFQTGQLHLLLDLPSSGVTVLESPELKPIVEVRTLPNRRIYFLAVNHRRTALQNEDLRRAIALAIDREGILTACFRAEHKEFHRPLNGPYPPGSWAYNPNLPPDP